MRQQKLVAALSRTSAKRSHVVLIQRFGSIVRTVKLEIHAAITLVKDRDDFEGYGTGRCVRTIEFKPVEKPVKWEATWRNTGAGCLPFWREERTAA